MTHAQAIEWMDGANELRGEGHIIDTPMRVREALGEETGGPFPSTPAEEAAYYNEGSAWPS